MGEKKSIYEAIPAVMEDVGVVGKDKYNKQQNFKYRGIDDVMNALAPALVKHKVFVVPEILDQTREERASKSGGTLIYSICRIRYTFFAEDGSYVQAVVVGEGMDSGDKATNKAMAIAFKYACFQTFCIPTEEMQDPDAESPEVAGKQAKPKPVSRAQQSAPQPAPQKVQRINQEQLSDLLRECERTGKNWHTICGLYSVEKFSDMVVEQYEDCMARFRSTPDKPKKTENPVPEAVLADEGLPWNTPA